MRNLLVFNRHQSRLVELRFKSFGDKKAAVPQILYHEEKAADQETMPPSYDSAAEVPWLEESLVTGRKMAFHYASDPTGRVVSLDDSYTGFVDSLGTVQTRCGAKVVSLPNAFESCIGTYSNLAAKLVDTPFSLH